MRDVYSIVPKVKLGIVKSLMDIMKLPEGDILDRRRMKVSNQVKPLVDIKAHERYELLRNGVEKLNQMKKKMEDDRKREEQELNERLYN